MICKKCNNLPSTVTLRKKDSYCDDCFMTSTNHKFRACIGKNKVLSPHENVLICLSGGAGSTVMLDLVHYSISLENNKKLRIVPVFIHIIENNEEERADFVIQQCKKYNFNVYIIHISDYVNASSNILQENCISDAEPNLAVKFESILKQMPQTSVNDFILKVKRNLFIKYAKELQCNFIFTAETTSTLAINLLCNLALGRGSQVQNDIGFVDVRNQTVKILRPMKDISKEELDYYITIKQLQQAQTELNKNNSLQAVISTFVCDLQENFASTISTVCKTADKIGNYNDNQIQDKCLFCESNLNDKKLKMSALEATNISRTVSFSSLSDDSTDILSSIFDNDTHTAMFPVAQKYLCYSCSKNNSDMNILSLPQN